MKENDAHTIDQLNRHVKNHHPKDCVALNGKCRLCGAEVKVEIFKTRDGYGINGGIVFAVDADRLHFECMACRKKCYCD